MTAAVLVFVNEQMVRVPAGANLADAVAALDPGLAASLQAGNAYLTDGRGIRLAADTAAFEGAIIRVVTSARTPRNEADAHA